MKFISSGMIVCPNQNVRHPPTKDSPTNWLRGNVVGLDVITVHGYIVDVDNQIPALFLKSEFDESFGHNTNDLVERYINYSGWSHLKTLSEVINCPVNLLLIPYRFPYKSTDPDYHEKKCIFYYEDIINSKFSKESVISLSDVKYILTKLRKRNFKFAKPLKSAMSYFECYLANDGYGNKSPWPGDIDGVLFFRGRHRAILEYKTHNLRSPIIDEYIGKYGKEDWRRFSVLNVLKSKLNVPIFFIVWGPNHYEVKIQVILDGDIVHGIYLTNKREFHHKIIELMDVY